MYEYDLFAVINHEGQMNNGHYTNFARFQDEVCWTFRSSSMVSFAHVGQWYRFDDDKHVPTFYMGSYPKLTVIHRVTHSNLGACLSSAAYMCFYVKRHLDYKPYMTPTYVLARETEAVKEKELEKEKELARDKELEEALLATT
jgi:ubiquitin carboxyl-terminal hydrolase 22/27/51